MKLWKRMGAAALAGALALSMAACGGGNAAASGTSPAATSSGGAAATGSNVLNVMTEVEVASLDPQLATDGSSDETQTLLDAAIEGCYLTGAGNTAGNTVAITYDAVVSPVSSAVTNTGVASVVFTVEWDI